MVVSMASWAPCHNDKPSATISNLRPSSALEGCKIHVAHERVRGDPSACLSADLRCSAFKRESSLPQDPLPLGTLRDGGQIHQVGGNIGRCGETGGGGKCSLRHKSRNGWGSIFSTLDVGNVRAVEPKGPCWTSSSPFGDRSILATQRHENLVSNSFVVCCCHPCFGWLGSGSSSSCGRVKDNSVQEGTGKPASSTNSLHSRTAWKQGAALCSKCRIMVSATTGCLCFTMHNVSAQLAKWAALLTLNALESPKRQADNDNVASIWASPGAEGVPKIAPRHPHTALSWRSAKPSVNSGWTALNQKLALVDPDMRRRKKAA